MRYLFSSILISALCTANALAQSATVTTYAGPPSPVNGAQATTQVFGPSSTVTPDGAGGFYFASSFHKRIYRVSANGILTIIAGAAMTGSPDGDGGLASNSTLSSYLLSIALGPDGTLFIVDGGSCRVLKVTQEGIISTAVGNLG